MLTYENTTVLVPNSKLSNEIIFNLSYKGKKRMDIDFKFNYGGDFENIKAVALRTIDAFDNSLKDPAPRVGVKQLDPDGFIETMCAWTKLTVPGYEIRTPGVIDSKY